ncbi:MAG: hypothetical protein MJZ26_02040 [Fibrobacter sp.]|nr:hypothetical protein [Fibrobacter sp.]
MIQFGRIVARTVLTVGLLLSASFAGYFLDETTPRVEPPRELPSWIFGGSFDIGFYLNALDVGASAAGEYRLLPKHSLGLAAGVQFGGELLDVALDYRFFFGGTMMEVGYDDFIHLAVAGMYFEKFDESYFVPTISVGYGRDFMPLRKADLLCRMEIKISYLIGETIADFDEGKLIARETHMVTNFSVGVFLF